MLLPFPKFPDPFPKFPSGGPLQPRLGTTVPLPRGHLLESEQSMVQRLMASCPADVKVTEECSRTESRPAAL